MTSRPCLSCGTVIPASASRCPDCQRARWRAEPSREARGYTRRHRTLSTKYRAKHPACELRFDGCELVAVDADHVRPLRAGGKSEWSNYQSACGACHRLKTAADRDKYPPQGDTR